MTSFASLMALSATRTRESQLAVEHALQERQRKAALQRKHQEEKEAKERELEKKRRLQVFEEEKRQQEKVERMEAEKRAKDNARERKEEEQKLTYLYGSKKAAKMVSNGGSPKYPMSAAAKESVARKHPENDEISVPALTREELRQRKRDAEWKKELARTTTKKHSVTGSRKSKQLPGGAVNIVVNANGESVTPVSAAADLAVGKSLKERLTQGPNTLVLLQTKARDRRTVDEAQQDIRIKLGKVTTKVLSGEDARNFDDWFGSSKDKEKHSTKDSPAPRSSSATPAPTRSISSRSTKAVVPSSSQNTSVGVSSRPSSTKPNPSTSVYPRSSAPTRSIPSDGDSALQGKRMRLNKAPAFKPSAYHATSVTSNSTKLKRRRSESLSRSPSPPPKRWHEDEPSIWEIVAGKPRSAYTRDIDSDDDDMEADAFILESEERMSSRIALKEDMQALEEERRHGEDKRQRMKDKQRVLSR